MIQLNNAQEVIGVGDLMNALNKGLGAFFGVVHGWVTAVVPDKGLSTGLAIILFTAIIRIILLPLNIKQMRSSIKMQEIQPEMKKLQDQYKNDPQKQQEEVMKLYKEKEVNPLGGCLPFLVQWPILIALYSLFRYLPDVKKAHFLWITDLAKGDLILPIISAATTFLSSYLLTPKTNEGENNTQALQTNTMNIFMSIFMGIMSYQINNSALVLYWVTNNLFQVGQVYVMKKVMKKPEEENVIDVKAVEMTRSSGKKKKNKK